MAEIDDALPNQSVSDEEFKETEVTEVETPNEDIIEASEDVEVTMDDDGGAEVSFDPNAVDPSMDQDHFANLAESLGEEVLSPLGNKLYDQYTEYKESRGDWEQSYREGLELLGFNMKDEQNLSEVHQGLITQY